MAANLPSLVADYLLIRRALGFKLVSPASILAGFLAYLEDHDATQVTVADALGFATADPALSRRSQALRLSTIRCFTRWAATLDPTIEVPPARLLPARPTRAEPFIYSDRQIAALLDAADTLTPPIRAGSMHTLIALMAATGVRTGEALGLDIEHWDRTNQVLMVTGKYSKTRILPVHPSVADGLGDYLHLRTGLGLARTSPALLVTDSGQRLRPTQVHPLFRSLAVQAGLGSLSPACRPRLHDLRHTFAVNTMLDAYRTGGNPAEVLPVLSTWLGHADPSSTYWYLTGTAELMAAAQARVQDPHPARALR